MQTFQSDQFKDVPENALSHLLLSVNNIHMGSIQYGMITGDQQQATLVLLHGFTGQATDWETLFADLALPGMRIIALDMPGHGRSTAPDDPQRYTIEHCQADVIAALEQLGVGAQAAILLGYSMGGRIALFSALSGYFRALVLESASPGLASPTERQQRRASDEALATCIEQEGVEAFVADWEQLPLFASQSNLTEETRTNLHAKRLNNRAQGLANSLRGVGTGVQPALHARLAEIALPTLLITGALDSKFCTINQQMAQILPDAQLQIVAGAGHTVHLEQPAAFVQLVRDFCKRVFS